MKTTTQSKINFDYSRLITRSFKEFSVIWDASEKFIISFIDNLSPVLPAEDIEYTDSIYAEG